MSKLKPIQKADLFLVVMKLATYALVLFVFFGAMAINNPQIMRPSRTMAITGLTFLSMVFVMNSVYGGYAVGKKKSKPVISSLSLSIIITDLVAYIQLQIMNVNEYNNDHIELFGTDFLYLVLAIVVQVGLIVFLVRLGNNAYFRIVPPRPSCVIAGPLTDMDGILKKIDTFKLQFAICDVIPSTHPQIEKIIARNKTVFLCGIPEEQRNTLVLVCYRLKKNIMCLAELEEIMLSNAKQTILVDLPFLEMEYRAMSLSQRIAKRTMDIFVAGIGLIVTSPIMLIAAIAIKLSDGGPIFFRQKRLSDHGKVFTLVKFRSMRVGAETMLVSATEEDDRITPVGHFLRRYRLDELPQLFNVLRGEMAIVGPRPEMLSNVEKYKNELPAFVYRERVKAGLTGYAQIEGKYNTSPKDKLMLDLMYIESFSLWLDIKLMFRTLTVFFRKESTEGFQAPVAADEKSQSA